MPIRTSLLRVPSAARKPERVPAAILESTSARPPNDAKDHPNSTLPADDADENASGDVQEFHPFDPHRAAKDIEVGDFYFKKKNYGAALDRYREALFYKPNDAMANFRMAQALDKACPTRRSRRTLSGVFENPAQRSAGRRGEEGPRETQGQPTLRKKPSQAISKPLPCHPERSWFHSLAKGNPEVEGPL